MKGYGRCAVIFIKAVGTAGDDPTLSFKQARTSPAPASRRSASPASTRSRPRPISPRSAPSPSRPRTRRPATTPSTPRSGTWTNSDLAEQAAIVIADIKAEDLDIANGFDCITCNIADVGTNAQLGTLIFVLHEPRNMKETLDSAIVD
jgi:hypothetical protein